MKTKVKFTSERKVKLTSEQKEARSLDIAAQRKRARDWALARHLRQQPILVTQEISVVKTSSDRTLIIQELQLRRSTLIKEL